MRPSATYLAASAAVVAMLMASVMPALERRRSFLVHVERAKIQGLVIRGDDLARFDHSSGTRTEFVREPDGSIARMTATREAEGPFPSVGVFYFMPEQLVHVFHKGGARITVRSRNVPLQPALRFRAALTYWNGSTSWSPPFEVSAEFQDFAFEHQGEEEPPDNPALLRIWPDVDGNEGLLDVAEVRIDHIAPSLRGAQ